MNRTNGDENKHGDYSEGDQHNSYSPINLPAETVPSLVPTATQRFYMEGEERAPPPNG